MSGLVRISMSLEADLLEKFDRHCEEGKFATRSEAIRQLLHQTLAKEEWDTDAREMTATMILVYDHHRAGLSDKLITIQHEYGGLVVATTHVHLDHDHCMEVVILRGRGSDLRRFAAQVRGLKGIQKGELVIADTALPMPDETHGHGHSHSHSHSHAHIPKK